MTSTTLSDVLAAYPERNAFEWDPLLHNLVPEDQWYDVQQDTPEFLAAIRAHAKKIGINPLWSWYGTNPLRVFDDKLDNTHFPITVYAVPSPLPEIHISGGVVVVDQLNSTGNTPIFKVQIGDDVRVMKVFVDAEPEELWFRDPERDMPWIAMVRFRREKEAYAHLLHYGACQKGVVPMCYGWADLPFSLVDELSARFGSTDTGSEQLSKEIAHLKDLLRPPKAIILEYIEDAAPISCSSVTTAVADSVLHALCTVHACYVHHNDIARRNILVSKDGKRIIIVDFDSARHMSLRRPKYVRRQDLINELSEAWSLLYMHLLPDKRIGWDY